MISRADITSLIDKAEDNFRACWDTLSRLRSAQRTKVSTDADLSKALLDFQPKLARTLYPKESSPPRARGPASPRGDPDLQTQRGPRRVAIEDLHEKKRRRHPRFEEGSVRSKGDAVIVGAGRLDGLAWRRLRQRRPRELQSRG